MRRTFLLKSMLLLCALVAGSSSVWADSGTLVSALNGIEDGETYYIAALNSSKYYTVPNTTIDAQTFTCSEGSLSGSTLTVASGAGEFVFTAVTGVDNAFYIYNTNLKKYLVATSDGPKFGYVESSSSDYGYWTFSTVSSGGFSGVFSVKHNNKTQYMRAYSNSVRCYNGTSNNGVYLFKKNPSNKVTTPSINGTEKFLTSTEVSISCATTGANIQYSLDNGTNWTNYSDAFTITETTTVKAKATKNGLTDSDEASATFTKITPMTVAEARAAIDAGTGTTGVYVRGIVCEGGSSLSSGQMNYWISDDGTQTDKFEIYKGKSFGGANFAATSDVEVGDIVVVYGNIKKYSSTYEFDSNSQLFNQIKKVAAPTFSPAAGAVAANTNVTISTTTEGATIYYTTDGSNPTTNSSVYSAPIIIDAAMTIKAFAVKDGHPDSDVATAAYTIAEPCATPTFSPAAGEVAKGTTVTISTETAGATIYYTTNGSDPTTSSTAYSSAITINSATTLKAIAVKDGMANSEVATAAYTVRDYVTLPFEWAGGTSGDLTGQSGVTGNSLGDYAAANAPYRTQLNADGDYILIKTNAQPGRVTIGVKKIGGAGVSTITVQGSSDGQTFTDIEAMSITGASNAIVNLKTTKAFATTDRYVKLLFTKSANVGVGPISIAEYADVPVSVGTYEWTTFVTDYAVDFTGSEVKAYVVTGHNDKTLVKSEVTTVAANTPLLLNAPQGSYNIPVATSTTDYSSTNKMKAGTGAAVSAESGKTKYVLSVEDEKATFLKIASDAATVPVGKAYLQFDEEIAAPALGFGDATGITSLTPTLSEGEGDVYNLNGQRVAQPTKGLYIVNGRKVVVK